MARPLDDNTGWKSERPLCGDCGHRAWPHGDQSGSPADGEPCHAAVKGDDGYYDAECRCVGYRPNEAASEQAARPGAIWGEHKGDEPLRNGVRRIWPRLADALDDLNPNL